MGTIQMQGLFAPFVAAMAGAALFALWHFNRRIHYLPGFALSLFVFAIGIVLFHAIVEKMTVLNAVLSNLTYFTVSGLMVHSALLRLGEKLNLRFHLFLMSLDLSGRLFILGAGLSGNLYLTFGNAIMGIPMVIGAARLMRHEKRDVQSIALAVSFGSIAVMSIIITPLSLLLGEGVTGTNYFSSYYWIFLSFLTVFGIFLTILSFSFTVATDIMRIKEKEASTDFLSGLLVRRAFDQEVNTLLVSSTRQCASIGVLVCDIDHFKQVNDQFGHQCGDKVIEAFGSLILKNLPEDSIAGRIGGEEFAVIVPDTDIDRLRLFAEGLRTAFSFSRVDGFPEAQTITASFGITMLEAGEQMEPALKRADEALYEAKNNGRDRVVKLSHDAPFQRRLAAI